MTTLNASVVCLIKTLFFFFPLRKHMVSQLWEVRSFLLVGRWLGASFQQPILEKLNCYHTVLHFFQKYVLNFYDLSSFCLYICTSRRLKPIFTGSAFMLYICSYTKIHGYAFYKKLVQREVFIWLEYLLFNNGRRMLWARLYKECALEKLSNMLAFVVTWKLCLTQLERSGHHNIEQVCCLHASGTVPQK